MQHKVLNPFFIFVLYLVLFCLLGSVLVKYKVLSVFSGEAVFAVSMPLPKADMSLFSALPYLEKNSLHRPDIAPTPSAFKHTPAPEAYSTYKAEPAILNETLQIKNSTAYEVDVNQVSGEAFPLSTGNPKVLIMHTHTSEAYAQSKEYSYIPSDAYRTEDTAYNICQVGKVLAETLESHNIGTVHDTTCHDYPSYSGCYNRSLSTIEKNLALYPSIEIVIDLHRDALSASDGSYMKTAAEINEKTAAQALVIVGTDAGGLEHPNWRKNLILGVKVQKTLCEMYPGLARPLHLRTERFNGHAAPGALLIEIGSNANTMEEALYSASLVGNALAKTIDSLQH